MGASCLDADGVATPERGPLVLLAHARLGTSAKSGHQDGRHLLGVSKAPVPAPVVTGLGRSLRGDRRVVLIRPQPVVDLLSSRTGRRTRRTRVQPGVTIPALVASAPLGHHADVLSRAQPSKSTPAPLRWTPAQFAHHDVLRGTWTSSPQDHSKIGSAR